MSEGWTLEIPSIGVKFIAERLRRERQELIGELTVTCALPGARTVNGNLITGDFNFSSVAARSTRAKLLAERAQSNGHVDWYAHLEEFCQGVFSREREGDPAMDIWDIPMPEKVDDFAVSGISLPRKHPSILFGDGGSAKSYMALYIAGQLAIQGVPVALFDWELSGDEHRERFERLFGKIKPPLTYCRCESPLVVEVDRLARIIRERKIRYAFFDSISFACDGRPEEAEIAARYLRATRSLGIGSLHIAHINKSEEKDRKPFGSSWWHNGARCTWYCEASEPVDGTLQVGFFNRKANLGPLRDNVSLTLRFGNLSTTIERSNMSDSETLVKKMTCAQRMADLLKRGALTAAEIADQLDHPADTVRRTAARSPRFILIQGKGGEQDKIGLKTMAANG